MKPDRTTRRRLLPPEGDPARYVEAVAPRCHCGSRNVVATEGAKWKINAAGVEEGEYPAKCKDCDRRFLVNLT